MQEKIMTTDLAAALLRDVPRFASPDGNLLAEEDVLAALSRAPDPALFAEVVEALRGAIGALEFSRDYYADHDNEEQAFAQDKLDAALAVLAKIGGGA